jgi:hypothetical protein
MPVSKQEKLTIAIAVVIVLALMILTIWYEVKK